LLDRCAVHQAARAKGWQKEGFQGSVLCVAQDHEVICKHDYVGDSRGLVGCSCLESIIVVIEWWLSILIVTQYREIDSNLKKNNQMSNSYLLHHYVLGDIIY
jgi:hypothetical protein